MTDRARPGLVAFYDIWPGNGAGLFLQLCNPHRAGAGQVCEQLAWGCRGWESNPRPVDRKSRTPTKSQEGHPELSARYLKKMLIDFDEGSW